MSYDRTCRAPDSPPDVGARARLHELKVGDYDLVRDSIEPSVPLAGFDPKKLRDASLSSCQSLGSRAVDREDWKESIGQPRQLFAI